VCKFLDVQARSTSCEKRPLTSSACPSALNNSAPAGSFFFRENLFSWIFNKACRKNPSLFKTFEKYQPLYMKTYEQLWPSGVTNVILATFVDSVASVHMFAMVTFLKKVTSASMFAMATFVAKVTSASMIAMATLVLKSQAFLCLRCLLRLPVLPLLLVASVTSVYGDSSASEVF
jgi:hypothetical protein